MRETTSDFALDYRACSRLAHVVDGTAHCSRYHTSTKRLTPATFEDVFKHIDTRLGR